MIFMKRKKFSLDMFFLYGDFIKFIFITNGSELKGLVQNVNYFVDIIKPIGYDHIKLFIRFIINNRAFITPRSNIVKVLTMWIEVRFSYADSQYM